MNETLVLLMTESVHIHFAQFESCVIALLAGTNLHIINTMIVDNNGNNVALQEWHCLVNMLLNSTTQIAIDWRK